MYLQLCVVFFIFSSFYSTTSSVIDNRTTNETKSQSIRALRQSVPLRKAMEYDVAPYHDDYYGKLIKSATARPQVLPTLQPVQNCTTVQNCKTQNAWPFIMATVFMILAVVFYIVLFCFVL